MVSKGSSSGREIHRDKAEASVKAQAAELVFVFPPSQGNAGAFKKHPGAAYLRTVLAQKGIATVQYRNENPGTIKATASDIVN